MDCSKKCMQPDDTANQSQRRYEWGRQQIEPSACTLHCGCKHQGGHQVGNWASHRECILTAAGVSLLLTLRVGVCEQPSDRKQENGPQPQPQPRRDEKSRRLPNCYCRYNQYPQHQSRAGRRSDGIGEQKAHHYEHHEERVDAKFDAEPAA